MGKCVLEGLAWTIEAPHWTRRVSTIASRSRGPWTSGMAMRDLRLSVPLTIALRR